MKKNLIEKTIELFQPLYGHPFKEEDALEIMSSVTEWFDILRGLNLKQTTVKKEECEHDKG